MYLLYFFFIAVSVIIGGLMIFLIYFLSPYSVNILIKLTGIAIVALFFLAFVLLIKNTYLVSQYDERLDISNERLPIKELILFTEDNTMLSVWEMRYHSDFPTVILSHGLGSNKADLLDLARGLNQKGYNCVLYDFRAHGKSTGKISSFGYKEQQDLKAVINYVINRPFMNNKSLGLYGFSMGAAVSILVAGEYDEVKAIVADSSYSVLQSTLEDHIELMYNIPKWLMHYPIQFAYWVRFFKNPLEISCIDSVRQFKEKAVFYINGAEDIENFPRYAKLLYMSTDSPKKEWIIPEEGHDYGDRRNDIYINRVLNFFKKYLPL